MNKLPLFVSSLLASAVLALSGCGSAENQAQPAPSEAATSPAATESTASSTAAATTENSPTADSATSSASSPTATVTSAEPTPTESASEAHQIAAPGTLCGNVSGNINGDIYVSGGPVSCEEAVSVVKEYEPTVTSESITRSRDAVATIQGYECGIDRSRAGATVILSGRSARCTSPAGSYVEVRDAGTRVLPGPVEEVSNYMVGTGPTDKIAFSTPDHSTYCMGSAEEGELTCIAGTNTKDSSGMPVMRSVKISKTAAPVVEEFSTALPYESIEQIKPVDVGTTLTSLGVSCSPQDASTMHCVNPLGGFTLSIDGYAPTA